MRQALLVLTCCAMILLPVWSQAAPITHVAQAYGSAEASPCVLIGRLGKPVAGHPDTYEFRDATGNIRVHMPSGLLEDRNITRGQRLRLTGQVAPESLRDNEIHVLEAEPL